MDHLRDQEGSPIKGTPDMALAAFYILHGLELVDVENNPHARTSLDCTFWFNDPDGRMEKVQLLWPNSVEHRYESQLRALRKICSEKRNAAKRANRRRHAGGVR
jgi:hypothetical protein